MSRIFPAAKTHLDGTHERTIICTQLFAGHEVGPWPFSEIEGEMHRMIIESIDCSQSPIFPRDRRCRSLSPTSRYLGLLMRAKLGREPSQPYPHPTLTHGLNPQAFCTLPSFARIKRERWRPVGLNDRHLRSQGKIRACKTVYRKPWHNNNQRKTNDELYIETHLKYFSRARTTMVIIFPG